MKVARVICLGMVLLLALPAISSGRDAREQKRIDFLIDGLGNVSGAVFIRNGTEYKATEAQAHLRQKLNYGGDRIKTAEDFIRYCASESSMSHKPYQIRFADGRTMKTADYFAGELKKFDSKSN